MIRFENVGFSYDGKRQILKDISFEIDDNASVGLIGANGAGKSTLIRSVLGFLDFSGKITVDGTEVTKKTLPEIRKKIGYVMQNSDNQMFMPRVVDDMSFGPRNYGMDMEKTGEKIDEILERLSISHLKEAYNHRLSGGEKKMASIATILTMEPSILIMDEPTSMLDPYNRRKIQEVINSLPQTKLIASHDLDFICDTCEKSILLYDGEIRGYDLTERIMRDRDLLDGCHLELPYRYQ